MHRRTKGETTGQIARDLGWKGEAMVVRYTGAVDAKQSAGRYGAKLGSLVE